MWSTSEFEAQLRAVGERRYHHLHPFHVRMHAGELSKKEFQAWVVNRFYYQVSIPVKDSHILAKLPSREDRQRWIKRIHDHDGREGESGGIELWLRLGEAVGIPRARMESCEDVLPAVRFAVDAYVNFCRTRPWLEAVASAMTEFFAPGLISKRIEDVQKHYPWIEPEGLAYFRNRLTQQPKDIEHLLQLVLPSAKTHEEQQRCVQALEFKCDVLWAILDAVEHAHCRRPASGEGPAQ